MGSIHHVTTYLLLLFFVTLINANLYIGDECQVTKTGESGKCKLLTDCEKVRNDLRFKAILPTGCGYQGHTQIVCCPISNITSTNTRIGTDLSLTVQKCKDYSRYVYINISVLTFDNYANAITKSKDRCGHTAVSLIVGGSPAASREFPHAAILGYQTSDGKTAWDCGGSLVSTRYVLTAGHCIKSPLHSVNVSQVRLGELVLNDDTDDDSVIDVPIERIVQHPDYSQSTKYNDIALLKLSYKVALSPYIRPICLPTEDLDPEKLIATGWGAQKFAGPNIKALQKVVLETFTNTECRDFFQYNLDRKLRKGIIDTQLCAGSRTEMKDTCQGDSGGPLQIYHTNTYCMYTQIGITSFGIGCGSINFPGVYTRLYNYVPWIESVIWAAGEDD